MTMGLKLCGRGLRRGEVEAVCQGKGRCSRRWPSRTESVDANMHRRMVSFPPRESLVKSQDTGNRSRSPLQAKTLE